jgi:hypothetical protein
MQRAAEIRCAQPWARIAHELAALKAIRYRAQGRAIVQRTKIPESLGKILKNLSYVGAGSAAGSATEMIFLGADMR